MTSFPRLRPRRCHPRGFTLLELLTTLIIILVLVGILIPTVKKMREKAQEASVKAQISSLDSAINRYQQDFNAFPGPLPRGKLFSITGPVTTGVFDTAGIEIQTISGAENLVLGLLGGLKTLSGLGVTPATFTFDPGGLSRGPRGLNSANPKSYTAYIDGMMLSPAGAVYKDGSGEAQDSVIPEILDRFSNPLPILYLRAQVGARGVVSIEGNDSSNTAVLLPATTPPTPTQYDLREILSYTRLNLAKGTIGEGKSIRPDDYKNFTPAGSSTVLPHGIQTVTPIKTTDKSDANYMYPYDGFAYLSNPSVPPTDTSTPAARNATGTPRNKDRYILISAGVDRVFGTADDITNAGSVVE
jgi:prepilin-type N-terminal cleavage/methylation domain-containing protein